ncbi:hypothetical protein KU891_29400 (plasmid) [Bacillus tropicus]|uniref:hypothetical protein n=1 Tax=Bacillus tropicus TaxID=2026188 RepID=UPI002005F9CE|nr:hypothetical protein [Bacillus tropicus]UOK49576.1 hypothetical protein KU891_29400 [Bacillus tropicus]
MKKIFKNEFTLVCYAVIFLGMIALYYLSFNPSDQSFALSTFLGSIIGGAISGLFTYIGVKITIENQKRQQEITDIRREKISILKDLIANRTCLLPDANDDEIARKFSHSLNSIIVVFHDSPGVMKCVADLYLAMGQPNDRMTIAFLTLCKSIYKDLDMKNPEDDYLLSNPFNV